jgi:hypothetical protein
MLVFFVSENRRNGSEQISKKNEADGGWIVVVGIFIRIVKRRKEMKRKEMYLTN